MSQPETLSPREPLTDKEGNITRSWWRFLNSKFAQVGTLAAPLVVKPSAFFNEATISAGGTIAAPDLAGQTLIGNPNPTTGQPGTIALDPSLGFTGETLGLSEIPPQTLLGNPSGGTATPGAVPIGGNLILNAGTLIATGPALDDIALWSETDRAGQIAALERKVDALMTLAMLSRTASANTATASSSGGGYMLLVNGDVSPVGIISDPNGIPVYVAE